MAMHSSSSVPVDGLSPQADDTPLRFPVDTFGEFLEKAREKAGVTQDQFLEAVNEVITQRNRTLAKAKQIPLFTSHVYGNLERNDRYPLFEEFEPLYQTLCELLSALSEPFTPQERERYYLLAQARFGQRKRRPKGGYMPTAADWPELLKRLAAIDARVAREYIPRHKSKAPYLLPVPSVTAPQIRLSSKVVSLLHYDTNYVLERDQYVREVMRLWEEEGKRLVVTKAISGCGKTRAFYVLLKSLARQQNHWPFYYALSSSTQTPDDYLDSLLSSFAIDLQLASPEDEQVSREERMEQIFEELARCGRQGLRLAVLVDDAHLLLDPSSGKLSLSWQSFLEQWIAREHPALLCLAAREWPHWRGRDRGFVHELELEPLSPAAGAEIWKRFGFGDVEEELREAASRKCGGYPQWIELRASDLDEPGHRFLWPRAEHATYNRKSADNQH